MHGARESGMKWAVISGMLGCLALGFGIPVYYLVNLHGFEGAFVWLFQLSWSAAAYMGALCLLGGLVGLIAGWIICSVRRRLGGQEGPGTRATCAVLGFLGGGLTGFLLGASAATVVLFSQLENVPLW